MGFYYVGVLGIENHKGKREFEQTIWQYRYVYLLLQESHEYQD